MTTEFNTIIGERYELVERIAEGGMAVVWKARARGAAGFSRTVAVKEIKAEFRGVRKYISMFIEEARIGTVLAHPNIVQVLDFLSENNTHFLVMEWVDGVDLHNFVRAFSYLEQPIPWPLAFASVIGALQGLAAAHERRGADGLPSPVVHRDISPHNILISRSGTGKLSDFGLARAKDRTMASTSPGVVKGKPSYFAPELIRGMPADVRSDIFSMAAVLWEVIAGRRLFRGETDIEVVECIRRGEIPLLSEIRKDVSSRVVDVIHRGLHMNPTARFPTARIFAAELSECLRLQGGGLFDANERLGRAVEMAVDTLNRFEPKEAISASEMNLMTLSLSIDTAAFGGSTVTMASQDAADDEDI